MAAPGGDVTVPVTAPANCAWTASSDAAFITVASQTATTGNGLVHLSVSENQSDARTGTATVAGFKVTIAQAAAPSPAPGPSPQPTCIYNVGPLTGSIAAAGGSLEITVSTPPGCAWTASTTDTFVAIAGGTSFTGSGTLSVTLAANSGAARTGTVIAAGQTVTITQAGAGGPTPTPPVCAVQLSAASHAFSADGESFAVTISAASGCAWTSNPSPSASFVTVAPSSGAGNGTVTLTAARNPGPTRSGTIAIGNATFTVTQKPGPRCASALSPDGQAFGASGGTGQFIVRADGDCAWTIENVPSYVAITSGLSGTGTGPVTFSVAANPATSARTGTFLVGGLTYTVQQALSLPSNTTFLSFVSDPGDYIGGGQSEIHTLADGSWQVDASPGSVRIAVIGPGYKYWWYLTMQAPNGGPLTVGTYEGATRWPFQAPTAPGLDFSGTGRGCNTSTGRFVVSEASYAADGSVNRFHVTFEQHCEGAGPAIRGEALVLNNPLR